MEKIENLNVKIRFCGLKNTHPKGGWDGKYNS